MRSNDEVTEFECEACGETTYFDVPLYESPRNYDDLKPDANIWVHGDVRVFEYKDHIEIKKDDWDRFKSVIIPLLKQGDKKHATGSNENWAKETNYASELTR